MFLKTISVVNDNNKDERNFIIAISIQLPNIKCVLGCDILFEIYCKVNTQNISLGQFSNKLFFKFKSLEYFRT